MANALRDATEASDLLTSRADRSILIADVVESVRLTERDEVGFVSRLLALIGVVKDDVLPRTGGHFVKSLGDGVLLDFETARAAVTAAFLIQHAAHRASGASPADDALKLRIGIQTGSVLRDRDDVFGRDVNRAARLVTLAGPGEIVVSAAVRDQLTADLDADVEDLGECYLKHLPGPIRAFRLGPPGARPALEPTTPHDDLLPALAVVPFSTRDPGDGNAVIGEVLAEELIRDFARSTDLNVISRLSTTAFRGRGATLAQIGEVLNANYVLSGLYQVDGGRLTVDAELAESKSGRIALGRRYAGKVAATLVGRRDLVDRIAADVSAAVMTNELRRAQAQPLPTLKSYTLLLGGIALMHRLSPDDFDRSRQFLESLAERAPRQAAPQAWLAKWHVLRVQQGWSDDVERDALMASQRARQALDADPRNGLALAMDGLVNTHFAKRLDVAQARYDAAIVESPNDSLAWLLKGTLHAFRGEGDRAVHGTQRALRLSPLDPHRYYYESLAASAHIAAGRPRSALDHARRSLRDNRQHTSTLRVMAVAQWRLGLEDEARRTADILRRLEPDLTVSGWLRRTPSAPFPVGREFARDLRLAGLPD